MNIINQATAEIVVAYDRDCVKYSENYAAVYPDSGTTYTVYIAASVSYLQDYEYTVRIKDGQVVDTERPHNEWNRETWDVLEAALVKFDVKENHYIYFTDSGLPICDHIEPLLQTVVRNTLQDHLLFTKSL